MRATWVGAGPLGRTSRWGQKKSLCKVYGTSRRRIAFRELRALRLVLEGLCRATPVPRTCQLPNESTERTKERRGRVLCWVDNAALVHIVNCMVTVSQEMMPELRLLKKILEREGLEIEVRRISSTINRYADLLSRTWDPTSHQLSTAPLTKSLNTCTGKGMVYRYRLSGGEHQVAQRKQTEAALAEFWGKGPDSITYRQSALVMFSTR